MATIRPMRDKWQAVIRRKGHPSLSKTFELKKDAEKWARQQERAIDAGQWLDHTEAQKTTLDDLLDRYAREVSITKRGAQIEALRVALMTSPSTTYGMTP